MSRRKQRAVDNRPVRTPSDRPIPASSAEVIRAAQQGQESMSRSLISRRNKAVLKTGRPSAPPWYAMAAMAGPSWKEAAFSSGLVGSIPRDNWSNYFERVLRYDVFWSHYEGTVFSRIHLWAKALKYDYKLYQHIRPIFSPAYRICEFWARHIAGGPLDPDAGDGTVRASALPIMGASPELRACIARLWRASRWQTEKNLYPRYGAVMGDVGLMVVDDPVRQRVAIRVVNPRTIIEIARDPSGLTKGYTLSELRLDPTAPDPLLRTYVTYTEKARQVGGAVEYTTYWNGQPFDWRDYPEGTTEEEMIGPTWVEDYPYVPFVLVQNRDMGLGFGWSELQPDLPKLYEQDDLASKLSDQIRKVVDARWFATGAGPSDLVGGSEDNRDEDFILYAPNGADMKPLVAPLDLQYVIQWVKEISKEIERDHPELATEDVSPDASGEARRAAREVVEGDVVSQRAPYDDGMVLIQKMAVAIAVSRGYPGYESLNGADLDLDGEALAHSIGDRPVFIPGESDRLAVAAQKSTIYANLTSGAGALPMAVAMELAGWPAEIAVRAETLRLAEAEAADAREAIRQNALFENTEDGNDDGSGDNTNSGDYEGPEDLEPSLVG